MADSNARPCEVKLFGRPMQGLTIDPDALPSASDVRGRHQQLFDEGARLALIYGYSEGGPYHHLREPMVLLVHGEGAPAEAETMDGEETASELTVWDCDQGDFSLRVDIAAGPITEILQDAEPDVDCSDPNYGGAMINPKVTGTKVLPKYKSPKVSPGSRGTRVA